MKLSTKHIPELDGLRGVAVIMVLLWHFVGSMWAPAYYATIFGRTGVDLFFVLSGFLIVGILIDNRNAPSLFRTFYIRRAARILPPYLLLIFVYWLCFAATGTSAAFNADPSPPVQVGAQILFAYNWLMAIANGPVSRGFSVTWSVAIEEQFYLLAPFVVWITPPRHLRKVIVLAAIASILARASFYLSFPQYGLAAYVLTPFRLDCLCAGAFIATIWRDETTMRHVRSLPVNYILLGLAGIAPLMVFAASRDIWWHSHLWSHSYLSVLYGFALLTILLRGEVSWLRLLPLQEVGRISYALYLLHPLFISLFFILAGHREEINTLVDVGLAAAALTVTVLACYASFHFLEMPIRAKGHRFKYERDRPCWRSRTVCHPGQSQ